MKSRAKSWMPRKQWAAVSLLCTGLALAGFAAPAPDDFRLVDAVRQGDLDAVRSLLAERVDVNAPQPDGSTALAWAAHRNDLDTAEMLLGAGANPNTANDYGVTPLSLACTNGNAPMVGKLLAAGADPNKAQLTGETPLMTCARAGNLEAVQAILSRDGVNVDARESRRGQTALMWAVAAKNAPVAKALIDHGADVNARSRVLETFDHLKVEYYGKDVHYPAQAGGFTPLLFAARVGDVESARVLLAAGAKVNDSSPEDGTALVVATASGHEQVARFLLENGADPNAADALGITPLHWALQEGLRGIVAGRTSPTDRFWHRDNMPELVRALLARGADPNAQIRKEFHPYNDPLFAHNQGNFLPQISIVGATPFLLAAASGDTGSMRTLVEGRANPLLATTDGTTPLMLAAGLGREPVSRSEEMLAKYREAAQIALRLGGDVHAVGGGQRTALHGAALMGDPEMVKFLVAQGADIEAKDQYGQTPLTIALGDPGGFVFRSRGEGRYDDRFRRPKENPKLAELLLELGATPYTGPVRDRSGE
jgi:ankyrin repeat protein